MRSLISPLLILFLAFLSGFYVLCLWRGTYPYGPVPSSERLLEASRSAPLNPDPHYRLGLFHLLDFDSIQPAKAAEFFCQAVERNPLEMEYWTGLAKIFQRMGEEEASEKALRNAILVFPTGYRARWTVGNLFLQQGQPAKAIPHFSHLLAHYPDQSDMVYDIWGKVTGDPEFILENLIPREPSAYTQFLSYLYRAGDKEAVKKVWERRASLGYKAKSPESIRHMDFLISHGELNEAYRIFEASLKEEGRPVPSRENLIVNGGFEMDRVLGGGFDWKIEAVRGAEVAFDRTFAREGERSLKIFFDGKENVDFSQVYQFVSLKPSRKYSLRAHLKTKALTTQNGVKLEIVGIGPAFYQASEPLIGDNDWKEVSLSFETPPQSQGGVVKVRRERTDKFDRFISGTVWIDNVRLVEDRRGKHAES
ncbi:MAG: carbohydrate binding domain-containing protein [Syntrophaceae bacterium]|nr:carbohydrate binding domain-containing protein [Syntrophaceae bacterium]